MSKYLLLFFGSDTVGTYINVMAYALEKLGVDNFIFVDLIGSPLNLNVKFDVFLNQILPQNLNDLANDEYENVKLQLPLGLDVYQRLEGKFQYIRRVPINYTALEQALHEYHNDELIVDISSLPKRVAFDILSECQQFGQEVCFFELKNNKGSNIDKLYHNLKENKDFEYIKYQNKVDRASQDKDFQSVNLLLFLALSIGANLIMIFEFVIYYIPWKWLISHPNSYGLQIGFDLLILCFVTGSIRHDLRKWCWVATGVTIVVSLIQILGGPR